MEIKLERSVPVETSKQKDAELNNLRNENKNLLVQLESFKANRSQKDTEIDCLRAKIDELASQLQQANTNQKSNELDELRNQLATFESRIKVIVYCDEKLLEKS